MKIVLNGTFGGFHLGKGFCKEYGLQSPWCWDGERSDERLVSWVEEHPDDNPELKVVEIPDEATDWQIHEYDGKENVITVLNGKIWWF